MTLFGGEFDSKMTEFKDVFRIYFEEGIKGYFFSVVFNDNFGKFCFVFGMGNKEVDDIIFVFIIVSYCLAFRDVVKSGSLDNVEFLVKVF